MNRVIKTTATTVLAVACAATPLLVLAPASQAATAVPVQRQAAASQATQAPSPVQALQTWYQPGTNSLAASFAVPGGQPDMYTVTLVNNKTGATVYTGELVGAPTPSDPLVISVPAPNVTHVLSVTAHNAAGTSAPNRAFVRANETAPSEVTSTRVSLDVDPSGGYFTTASWNAPKFSPDGQVTRYRVYDTNSRLLRTVDTTTVTLDRAESDRANPAVLISAVAVNGAEGPKTRIGVTIPDDGYRVNLTAAPETATVDEPASVSGRSAGYNPGNWVNVWVQNPDGQWVDAGGQITGSPEFNAPATFTTPGTNRVQLSIGSYPHNRWSNIETVTVEASHKPSVTFTGTTRTEPLSGQRWVELGDLQARNMAEGTPVQVQAYNTSTQAWDKIHDGRVNADSSVYIGTQGPTGPNAAGAAAATIKLRVVADSTELTPETVFDLPEAAAHATTVASATTYSSGGVTYPRIVINTTGYPTPAQVVVYRNNADGTRTYAYYLHLSNDGSAVIDKASPEMAITGDSGSYYIRVGGGQAATNATVHVAVPQSSTSGRLATYPDGTRAIAMDGSRIVGAQPGQNVTFQTASPATPTRWSNGESLGKTDAQGNFTVGSWRKPLQGTDDGGRDYLVRIATPSNVAGPAATVTVPAIPVDQRMSTAVTPSIVKNADGTWTLDYANITTRNIPAGRTVNTSVVANNKTVHSLTARGVINKDGSITWTKPTTVVLPATTTLAGMNVQIATDNGFVTGGPTHWLDLP